jgi:hypothetical protein
MYRLSDYKTLHSNVFEISVLEIRNTTDRKELDTATMKLHSRIKAGRITESLHVILYHFKHKTKKAVS